MPRWEPGARERLRDAALELYDERGFEAVTVADITERAGLTRRTFFRHFTDARDVLFAGSEQLPAALADAVRGAAADLAPFEAVVAGLGVVGEAMITRVGATAARRNAIICASPELRERERTKFADVADAVEAALVERGTPQPGAQLLAGLGVSLFQVAFAAWVEEGGSFTELVDRARAETLSCLAPSS